MAIVSFDRLFLSTAWDAVPRAELSTKPTPKILDCAYSSSIFSFVSSYNVDNSIAIILYFVLKFYI